MTVTPPKFNQTGLWLSPAGRRVAGHEARLLQPLLRRMHGESVLWIGEQSSMPNALAQCMVRLPIFASPTAKRTSGKVAAVERIQASCHQLPFTSNSLDGVVLHHALETYADPRACIREVERVLKPGGRLLICSFNPFSLTGLRTWVASKADNPLSGRRLISPIRLLDWMALLNLRVDETPLYSSFSAPAWQGFADRHGNFFQTKSGQYLARLWDHVAPVWRQVVAALEPLCRRLPVGGVFVLTAFKEGHGGTLIGRSRLETRRKSALALTPTVQSPHDG